MVPLALQFQSRVIPINPGYFFSAIIYTLDTGPCATSAQSYSKGCSIKLVMIDCCTSPSYLQISLGTPPTIGWLWYRSYHDTGKVHHVPNAFANVIPHYPPPGPTRAFEKGIDERPFPQGGAFDTACVCWFESGL